MEIQIRPANERDYIQLLGLFKEFAVFEKLPGKMINSVEKMIKEKEAFNAFVAVTHEQRIVGYASYFFCYYTWIGKSLYMDDLYVKPEYRGNKIGTRLLQKVIEFAKESGYHKLRWQVWNWNESAQTFYRSLGAEIDSTELNCDLVFN